MNKLLEILYDNLEGDDFEKKLDINSKDIIKLCGGNWVHLKESPYWMTEDIVLENNDKVELRMLQDPIYKNMLLDYPGRTQPFEIKDDKVKQIFMAMWPSNEDRKRYIKTKNSLINEGWRRDVGEEFQRRIEIYMFVTKKQSEYVIDFMVYEGNHRMAIVGMYNLELDIPITLKGRFYTNNKNNDLPKNDEAHLNNMMRRPLFLKIKTKKTKPVTL